MCLFKTVTNWLFELVVVFAGSERLGVRDVPAAGGHAARHPGRQQHPRGRAHPQGLAGHHQVLQPLPQGLAVPQTREYSNVMCTVRFFFKVESLLIEEPCCKTLIPFLSDAIL